MSSDTPRTDAADLIVPSDLTPDEQWRRNGQYVSADFARTLERELTAAQQEIERLTATVAAKDEAIKRLNGWLDNDRRALGEEG